MPWIIFIKKIKNKGVICVPLTDQSLLMEPVGQLFIALSTQGALSSAPAFIWAFMSAPTSKTSGQRDWHTPHPMQLSSFILSAIFCPPLFWLRNKGAIYLFCYGFNTHMWGLCLIQRKNICKNRVFMVLGGLLESYICIFPKKRANKN